MTAALKALRLFETVSKSGSTPIWSSAMPAPRPLSRSAAKQPSLRPISSGQKTGFARQANTVINIASQQPLISHPGIVTFGKTRRLCNMANLTATCPELAPPGWHLYVAYAVPIPALGDFDQDAEVELALTDLREQFPNFGQAKILSVRVMRDDWPAQRSCAGYDLPRETGIDGLWCVGDAVKQYGNGATQACAETAKIR